MQYIGKTIVSKKSCEELFKKTLFYNALMSVIEEAQEDRERVESELLRRFASEYIDFDAEATELVIQVCKSEIADYLKIVEKKIQPIRLLLSKGEQ